MKTFTFHTDAGHGWLEVSTDDLRSVSMCAASFSRYSYRDTGKLYLEEDCDASKFIAAWQAKHGAVEFRERYQHSSFVRNLPRLG